MSCTLLSRISSVQKNVLKQALQRLKKLSLKSRENWGYPDSGKIFMQNESIAARTKRLLAGHDLHAKKGLGQNFLIDGNILKKIAATAEITLSDTVIEVG